MNTVLEYIKAKNGVTKANISEATGIKGLPLFNQLKKLVNDGHVVIEGEAYTAVESASEETNVVNEDNEQTVVSHGEQANSETHGQNENQPPVATGASKKNEQPATKASTSRNNDRFSFKGQDGLGKGPLCREFLKAVVADNPGITMKKLNELVPQSLIPRFGLYEEVEAARKISGQKYDRYFFKEEHVIKLKDKKIVVCNQLTSQLLSGVIAKAKELGYKIS